MRTQREPSNVVSNCRKRGLGDIVADFLAAIGITKELVSAVIGKPCGCAKRQKWLTELGRKLGIG